MENKPKRTPTILQGKTYYDIIEINPKGYFINPINSNGTVSKIIRINVNDAGYFQPRFRLPTLSDLNGFWDIEIFISSSVPTESLFRPIPILVSTQSSINQTFTTQGTIERGSSVIFTGVSENQYVTVGNFSQGYNPESEAIKDTSN